MTAIGSPLIQAQARARGLFWQAKKLLWLAVLGPFFFLTYGFANSVASHQAHVPSVAFGWEKAVPFVPWTIVPYWTSDLLYALSLLICTTRRELSVQVKRLIAAQVISVSCFLVFPLRLVFERPETHGFFGWLFDVLIGFDKPFNQAPSLHVSLAVILWSRFSAHLSGTWRAAMGAWLMLVVVSTMTTYQHQFLDLPTGALAGLLAIALFPDSPWRARRAQRLRLAIFYLSGSALAMALALKFGGPAWALLWPAAATLVVAFAYAADRPGLLQVPLIRLIAAPYTTAAWMNSRWWTRAHPEAHEIADGVWLGRVPAGRTKFQSIVNLSAELAAGRRSVPIPMLDLVAPTPRQLREAAAAIQSAERPTLVCCALGYSRSARAVAAWLVATGRAPSWDQAIARIRSCRPRVEIGEHECAPDLIAR